MLTRLQFVKLIRQNLTPEENFDPNMGGNSYPHCILGEMNRQMRHDSRLPKGTLWPLLARHEKYMCLTGSRGGLTHKRALQILDRVIKRLKKRGKA